MLVKSFNQICFWLIEKVIETNAEKMTTTLENVTRGNENLGDWEITVKKKK